ncbi:MAG: nucleotide exchange factor GrpE [Candidatus Omnitrophota bacterium]
MQENNPKKNHNKPAAKANGKDEKAAEPVNVEPETVTVPKEVYDALLAKCSERDGFEDKFLRIHAEFENARRRLEKDKADFLKYANEGMLMEFMPILDNLDIAEKHIKEAKDFNAVREGVDMIQSQIQRFLKDIGVERIKTVGEKFDPHVHEAILVDQASDKEEDTVIEELKAGYMLSGKMLRPAMVKIAKKKTE